MPDMNKITMNNTGMWVTGVPHIHFAIASNKQQSGTENLHGFCRRYCTKTLLPILKYVITFGGYFTKLHQNLFQPHHTCIALFSELCSYTEKFGEGSLTMQCQRRANNMEGRKNQ